MQIMAIINTSPDSFSGDGAATFTDALRSIKKALREGADILDIGGQSTRPGAKIISATTEIQRVVPVILAARKLTTKPISVDTFKPAVAKAAIAAGANIVNDVTGARDPKMVKLVAATGVQIVVMHMRGTPATMSSLTDYPQGVMAELLGFFTHKTADLQRAGIAKERIIIDPGIGFAKTPTQSFAATKHLQDLRALGFRVLYGASKKSFIGKTLGTEDQPVPPQKRAAGTLAANVYATLQGADILRVHDVRQAADARTIINAITEAQ